MVSHADFNSRGRHNWIVRDLRGARRAAASLERGISRPLMISGVTPSGLFQGDADDTLQRMRDSLRNSGRLFRQGNTLIFLQGGRRPAGGCSPTPVAVDGTITRTAPAIVRNVVMCRELKANSNGKGSKPNQPLEYEVQFAVPQGVLQQVVAMDGFTEDIHEARYIVNHPVFDRDFNWLDVGYHEPQHVLVCGDSFEPAVLEQLDFQQSEIRTVADVLLLLPPQTRRWVAGFHWNGPVDLINYLGTALMIPLMPMLVEDGHPGVMLWGNKPGIGKSLAAQCLAILKDGEQASPTSVDGGSREVENQIASELNDGRTVLFIDNQKGVVNVPVLEANMTAAQLGFRGFNIQRKIRRPNDLLWLLTTNDAAPSDDLLSRCVHIRLHYEGIPDSHRFTLSEKDLIDHVRNNRSGILAELAGFVIRWLDAGRPSAPADCRFGIFGRIVGSVLTLNGLPGFLTNAREEVREHSTKHQQLVAIVGRLLDGRDRVFVLGVEGDIEDADDEFKRGPRPVDPREQKDWVPYLASAGVITAACSTPEKQKVAATQYLNEVLKVPVEIEVGDHTAHAMIVSRPLGKRRVAYALAVKGLPPALKADGDGDGRAEVQVVVDEPHETGDVPSPNVDGGANPPPSPEPSHSDRDGSKDASQEPEDDLWGPN